MLEHWHPQLIREEAALVFSTDREVALNTNVARILAWVKVSILSLDRFCLEGNIDLVSLNTLTDFMKGVWEKIMLFWSFPTF